MENKIKPLLKKLAAMDVKRGSVRDFVEHEYIDDDGNAIIDVNIEEDENLFSPYSDKKVLNPEILHYIDTLADPLPAYLPLIVNFIVDDKSKLDQDFIKTAFKRHYWLSYKQMSHELRRISITSIILFLVGCAILVVYYLLDRYQIDFFANEIILIASWVFIWESVSRFFFGRREKQIDRINEGQMAVAVVRFENRSGSKTRRVK
jgi:hypothetical protein